MSHSRLYRDLQLQRFADMVEPGGLTAIRNLAGWGAVVEERPDLLGLQVVFSAEALADDSDMHEHFAARYRDLCTMIVGFIDEGIESGEIRPDADSAFEATAFLAFMDNLRLQWLYSGEESSIDDDPGHVRRAAR